MLFRSPLANEVGGGNHLRLSLQAASRDFRLRLSRASSCLRRRLASWMTPERDTSRLNCRRSSPPSTFSSPASAFALWYLGLAAGAHGEVGVGTETERERATVGGHPRGKEAIVVLRPAWRRGDGDGDEKKARAAAAAVGMVVALAGDGRGQGGGLLGFGRMEKAESQRVSLGRFSTWACSETTSGLLDRDPG